MACHPACLVLCMYCLIYARVVVGERTYCRNVCYNIQAVQLLPNMDGTTLKAYFFNFIEYFSMVPLGIGQKFEILYFACAKEDIFISFNYYCLSSLCLLMALVQ